MIRSEGSVDASYIEANEHLSGKDFTYRAKMCRKEAKEAVIWLRLLKNSSNEKYKSNLEEIIIEEDKLKRIL